MKKAYLAALLATLVSAPSMAQSPSFNYAEASYFDADGLDGVGLSIVTEISDNFVFLGDFSYATDSFMGIDVDVTSLSAGIGYRYMINEQTALLVGPQLLYAHAEASGSFEGFNMSNSESETGFGVVGMIRHMAAERVELNAGLQYVNISDFSSTDPFIGARVHLNQRFSLSASYSFDDADTFAFGLAYHF